MHQVAQWPLQDDDDVGRIVTPVRIENNLDVELAASGVIAAEAVRAVEVADALVDTGATSLCLPLSIIESLGLRPLHQRNSRTAAGERMVTVFSSVRLTIQGRDSVVRVTELPEGSPVLIGQIPLEEMDLVPYPKRRLLLPNPAHGDEWTIEIY